MFNVSLKINQNELNSKVKKAALVKADRAAYKKAYDIFYRAKKKMLQEFEEHNVTQELLQGINNPFNAPNISNTLDGGYGNLYAFIGFDEGTDPIKPLRTLLDEGTRFRKTVFRNDYFYFKVTTPSKEEIEAVTPMPWEEGNSWVDGIESGMTNLSFFLSKRGQGRSGGGVMVKGSLWEVNEDLVFKKVEYVSKIMKDFVGKVERS